MGSNPVGGMMLLRIMVITSAFEADDLGSIPRGATVIDKKEFLLSRGWYTLWDESTWVERNKEYYNIDWAGVSIDEAYKIEYIREQQRIFDRTTE